MARKINPHGLKADDIRVAMKNRWTAPEWAIMWEVNQGTGVQAGRSADAMMMSLWPSRGLELHGVEIKVSRSDWKREAKDPTKAETIAKFCDRWWIHTPENVVDDLSDLPPAWGLREWSGKRWKTIREAEKTSAEPISRTFLAALLRRSEGATNLFIREQNKTAHEEVEALRKELREKFQSDIQNEVDRRTQRYIRLQEAVVEFERITGRDFSDYRESRLVEIAKAAAALSDANCKYGTPSAEKFEAAAECIRALQNIDKIGGDHAA